MMKFIFFGAHPDDPETCAGGTIVRAVNSGIAVTCLYLTRGENGFAHLAEPQAAAIRTREAETACGILGCAPMFVGQIDGRCVITPESTVHVVNIIREMKPDAVFTHWPLDTHPDHRIAALLALHAWMALDRTFSVFFFEAMLGIQTLDFHPTHYVDISDCRETKLRACFAHTSQNIQPWYEEHHGSTELMRGKESDAKYAEAFVHLSQSQAIALP